MQNNIKTITATWTYNHKLLLVTVALGVALIFESGLLDPMLPTLEAQTITYETPDSGDRLIDELDDRARALYKQNENMDLEKYRQQAIREMTERLLVLTGDSNFVDYVELRQKYGF